MNVLGTMQYTTVTKRGFDTVNNLYFLWKPVWLFQILIIFITHFHQLLHLYLCQIKSTHNKLFPFWRNIGKELYFATHWNSRQKCWIYMITTNIISHQNVGLQSATNATAARALTWFSGEISSCIIFTMLFVRLAR